MFVSMYWRFQTHSVMPRREKSSPKWYSTQAVEERSTTPRRSDKRCILGLVLFEYWCVAVVLDRYLWYLICWIVIYCIYVCCCLYIIYLFLRLPDREVDKIEKNKKILMFIGYGSCGGRRGWSGLPSGSYVCRRRANVIAGSAWTYVSYVHRSGGTDERKGLRFDGSTWPTNVS
jgi:hypothetical protein